MNVLEEFWYGNLDPAEYDANSSKEYKELAEQVGEANILKEDKRLFLNNEM